MYVVHDTLLGNAPESGTPSIWDSFLNLAQTGVQAGFNIYNKVQNIKQTQQQASQAQTQALALAQAQRVALTQPMPGAQPGMVSFITSSSWVWPVAIGAGALVLIAVLRK